MTKRKVKRKISKKTDSKNASTLEKKKNSFENKKNDVFQEAWNYLDLNEEQETEILEDKVKNILNQLHKKKQSIKLQSSHFSEPLTGEEEESEKFKLDPHYNGPRIPPISELVGKIESLIELVEFLKSGGKLPYRYAFRLINQITNTYFEPSPNISHVNVPEDGKLTVVGDIHGQLNDLLTIFKQNGYPSLINAYIFNGDFVDRGDYGMEVLLILYCCKAIFPSTFFLNRGNHEQAHVNSRYGFESEVKTKYDAEMFECIQKSFKALPLCTIIQDQILVLHGGLFSENVSLKQIRNLSRKMDVPGKPEDTNTKIIQELLWSDPSLEKGITSNSRGIGIKFGEDITCEFLKKSELKFLIRSHELQQNGYSVIHNRQLITLFSASYYCGTNFNKGAYLVFDKDMNYSFYSFYADSLLISTPEKDDKIASIEEKLKTETLQKLREKIFQSRHDLLLCFSHFDLEHNGTVTIDQWSQAMLSVLNLPISWNKLLPYLSDLTEQNTVNYIQFLDRYQLDFTQNVVKRHKMEQIISKVCHKMLEHSTDLEKLFQKFDKYADGKLSYDEFISGLLELNLELPTDDLYFLMQQVDKDHSGAIDKHEFLSAFQKTFSALKKTTLEQRNWLQKTVTSISQLLSQKRKQLEIIALFKRKKQLPLDQFYTYLEKESLKFTKEEKKILDAYIQGNFKAEEQEEDVSLKGITKKDLSSLFGVVHTNEEEWKQDLINKICERLFRSRVQLYRAFQEMDLDDSGTIDFDEFKAGLEAMDILFDSPLSDSHILELFHELDKNGDGVISLEEFLAGFHIVDIQPKKKETTVSKSTKNILKKRKLDENEEQQTTEEKDKASITPSSKKKKFNQSEKKETKGSKKNKQ